MWLNRILKYTVLCDEKDTEIYSLYAEQDTQIYSVGMNRILKYTVLCAEQDTQIYSVMWRTRYWTIQCDEEQDTEI